MKKRSKVEETRVPKFFNTALSDLKQKAMDDGSVIFEGWANKAVVDRGKDLISKKEWKLGNYLKNSILLFNHDHSQPIGTAIQVEARDEGLYVKARISKSKDATISRIRDLVSDGVLNSLSVGIYVEDEERTEKANILKGVELHEISIVAVPMNQDSQFAVKAKSLATGSFVDSIRTVAEASGYTDVAKVLSYVSDDARSLNELSLELSIISGIDVSVAHDFLQLNGAETHKGIKDWIVKKDLEEKIKGLENVAIQAVRISKETAATQEDAIALGDGTSWDMSNIVDDGDAWVIVQIPEEEFTGELRSLETGSGVTTLIGERTAKDPAPEEKGLLDGQGLMPPNPAPMGIPETAQLDPVYDQMLQSNVLLSEMVSLLQQLSQKFDTLAGKPTQAPPVPVMPTKSMDSEAEIVKMVDTFSQNILKRLDRLEH